MAGAVRLKEEGLSRFDSLVGDNKHGMKVRSARRNPKTPHNYNYVLLLQLN